MNSAYLSSQTDDDFSKARSKAFFNELQHFLNPEEATLISFSDIKKLLKPQNEVYKGMMVVPVKLIVGSEGRYKDFDNRFLPKSNFLKERWEKIDRARLQDINLPPISVYEVGGLYFVRDGNHRVSVAKSQGAEFIDAEVVSLQSEIKLKPTSTKDDILKQVINYEKRTFYNETSFGDITDYWCLDFTSAGQYDVIYNHIITHKYYMNIGIEKEISFEDAVQSWFEKVYLPVIRVLDSHKVMKYFKKNTKSDIYVFLIKYWDDIKRKLGNTYSLDDAADGFKHSYGSNFFKRIKNLIEKHKMLRSKHEKKENNPNKNLNISK